MPIRRLSGAFQPLVDRRTQHRGSLKKLIDEDLIDRDTAFAVAPNQDALKMVLKGIDVKASALI